MHEAWLDGFALAATIADDSGASRALAGLGAPLESRVGERASWLASLEATERRSELERLASSVRLAVRATAELPARARAVVAGEVDRDTARRWAAGAPPPRRRWVAGAALRSALRRLAARPAADDANAAGHETGAGRALLARIDPPVELTLGVELGAEEAAAVVAMRALGAACPHAPIDDRLLTLARSLARPGELARVVGALALGASGRSGGDAWSTRLRDTGREIAELEGMISCPA